MYEMYEMSIFTSCNTTISELEKKNQNESGKTLANPTPKLTHVLQVWCALPLNSVAPQSFTEPGRPR